MATILLVLTLGCVYNSQAIPPISHYGNQFYIGMIPYNNYRTDISIDIASRKEGNAVLNIPYLNVYRNETIHNGSTTLTVNGSLIQGGNFKENRGIYLDTDVPVAVYVSWKHDVMDTYLALPLTALGTQYTAASYDPYGSGKAEMMIIGAFDNTTVVITDRNNTNSTLSLNRMFVNQLSGQTDISNSVIMSNKPVAVISGTDCALVPHGVNTCDMLLEQMLPSSSWDNIFIVSPVFPKLGFILKVFPIKNHGNVTFCLTNSTKTICNQPHKDEYLMGTEPVLVTSNAPISVVQYGVGQQYDNIDGDEFMTVIPGIDNYLNSYYFVIPNIYTSLTSRLAIVVSSVDVRGLRLDGSPVVPNKTYTVPDPFSNYTVIIVDVTVGYHELIHTNRSVIFGVTAYGLGLEQRIGYGFPVGFRFSLDNNATSSTVAKTSTASSTLTPSTVAATSTASSTLTPSTVAATSTASSTSTSVAPDHMTTIRPIENVTDIVCFSCDDLSHVELCDAVKHCDVDEVCYVESYEQTGRKLYRSGCLKSTTCLKEMDSYQHSPNRCVECCSQNYCNNRGCGDNGLSPRDQRGPMCYDCPHEWSPRDCNRLALCEKDETCSVEEFRWGEHSHFKMGCAYGQCTPSSRSVHIATRALPVCRSCCTDDYCNLNCTRSDVGSVIVG